MSPTLITLLLLALGPAATGVLPQDSLPSLMGSVRSDGLDGFLTGATVEVRQGMQARRSKVGPDGFYRFDGLRPGGAELAVFHFAALPTDVRLELPASGEVRVDLVLRHRVIPVAGLHIRGVPDPVPVVPGEELLERRRAAMGLRSLETSSGVVESGLASALSPDEPGDPGGVLYARGSPVDARLVLLDGAPVLTPFHVAGLLDPFDSRLLEGAELYLGGAPSPYSGGVSYILDVETRDPREDRPGVAVGADGLTLEVMGKTPLLGKGSVLVGGRLLHGLQDAISEPDRFPYRYHDLLVRVGLAPAVGHDLRVTTFQNREGVRLDLGGATPRADREASWGNRAISAGYTGGAGDVALNVVAAASRYESRLPIQLTEPVLASGVGDRLRVVGSAEVQAGSGSLRLGASLERPTFTYGLHDLSTDGRSEPAAPPSLGTTEVGAFGEWEGEFAPGLSLRAGFRADRYSHEGRLRLSPRLGLRLELGEQIRLFAAGGQYHQVLPAPGLRAESNADPNLGTAPMLSWDPTLPVAGATHLVVGMEQEFDREVQLILTAFAKRFSGLGQGGEETSRSSGTELRVSREGGQLRGWFGYALSWFWIDEGSTGSTRFNGRQLLSAGIEATLPGRIEIGGVLGYGAGLPMTAVGLPSRAGESLQSFADAGPMSEATINQSGGGAPLGLAPEDDFLRMDLEVAWPMTPRIAGRSTELRPYFKVLNALNRRDAVFYYFDEWHEDTVRPLATQPLLPLVGLRWSF